jgi:hypothetical protein
MKLILFFLIFDFVSCGSDKVIIKEKVVYVKPKKCYKPIKPKLIPLDQNQALTSSKNVYILLNDLIEIKSYTKSLEATIECYEAQINRGNQNDNKEQRRIGEMDKRKRN